MTTAELGERIRAERTTRSLSQTELAVKAQMKRQRMNAIECGRALPTMEQLEKIAFAMDLKPEEIYTGNLDNLRKGRDHGVRCSGLIEDCIVCPFPDCICAKPMFAQDPRCVPWIPQGARKQKKKRRRRNGKG